jgi:hypothetical protein
MFCKKERYPYQVTVHINGRHPYLEGHELDKETRDVVMTVPATSWKEAERLALNAAFKLGGWRYHVSKIEKDW